MDYTEELFKQARCLQEKGKFQEAEGKYSEVIRVWDELEVEELDAREKRLEKEREDVGE